MFADISHERQQSLLRQRNLFALSSAGLAVALAVAASLPATRDREVVLLPTLPKQLTVSSAGVEADYLELVTRDTALVLLNLSGEGSVAPFRRPSLPLQTSDFFNFFNSIGRKRFDRFDAFCGIQSLSLRPLVSHVRWPRAANPRARPLNKWTRLSTYTGIMTRPMRKDAAQRRDALQKAAAVEFTERGLNVPLGTVGAHSQNAAPAPARRARL